MKNRHPKNQGFTLIELSIALIIIGLIVGGILVGQDMINAAATRAQIAQIEKYQTAANTFYTKYGYLPGDIPAIPAAQFGLIARGPTNCIGANYTVCFGNYTNYSGIEAITAVGDGGTHVGYVYANTPGLTVAQAYSIDKKIDDGLPQSGRVTAVYLNSEFGYWAGTTNYGAPYTTATPGSATTCSDNGNAVGTQQYSMEQSNGSGVNCALTFKMQGAAR
jgi:prepilin-type N-terminal cleavage/methylation domain-containing protein